MAAEVAEKWDQAVAALDRALRIMATHFGALKVEFIPSMDTIAALAAIVANPRFREDRDLKKLSRWYWCTGLSQYLSSAPESKIERTLREWTREGGWLDDDNAVPEVVRDFTFSRTNLDDATRQTGVYKACMAMMMANKSRDIWSDRTGLANLPGSEIADHHIFPQKFLHNHGIKGNKANDVLNRMPLWQKTNLKIAALAPDVYLHDTQIVGNQVCQSDLDPFGIDIDFLTQPFSRDGFELFLMSRKERIMAIIADAVEKEIQQIVPAED